MKTINIKSIRIDGGTQSRVEINNEIVFEYASQIKDGTEFPPVVVFNDGTDLWLADGFHRFHANNTAGKVSIVADVRTGTARDAVLFSLGANSDHGIQRTAADKRKAVTTMLQDQEWGDWSDNAIAKACHVAHSFVGGVRRSLDSESSEKSTGSLDSESSERGRKYKTKHGTTATMKTGDIGKKATKPEPVEEKPAEAKPAPKEYASDGESIKDDDEFTELDAANIQIQELQDMLVVANLGNVSAEEKSQAANLIAELRQEIKILTLKLKTVTGSRDTLQNENAELRKQINRQRKEIDRATGRKTA